MHIEILMLHAANGGGGERFFSKVWNSTYARALIPDRISVSLEGNVAVFLGFGQDVELNVLTRGKDARILPYLTNTLSRRYGFEGDAGIQLNLSWHPGPVSEISRDLLIGPTRDFDAGVIYGGNISFGYDDFGNMTWFGIGGGVGGTLGGSYGIGDTNLNFGYHPAF